MKTKSTFVLPSDATYIIAGGLGGLGRSAAQWLSTKGAKNLVLLSRSGPVTSASKELVHELQSFGVRVETPRCDVSDARSLSEVLRACELSMPPIRGCIQGTMVLRVSKTDSLYNT